jgi:hypothetical protein
LSTLFIEVALGALVISVFWTQIFRPVMLGRPLFPLFRSRESRIQRHIDAVRDDIHCQHLERELETLKHRPNHQPNQTEPKKKGTSK